MSGTIVSNDAMALEWLAAFGYDSMEQFQELHELESTGQVCTATAQIMSRPRCGVKDFQIAADCRWKKKRHLLYYHGRGFNLFKPTDRHAGKAISSRMIADGFAAWAAVTPFTFARTSNPKQADIWIGGGRGRRYDFDGPGNVLAWAYMPCGSFDFLETRFDVDEKWSHNSRLSEPWIYASAVWLHELGHCLGLDHSSNHRDLMAPYYDPAVITLQSGDIQRIRSLYA